MARSAINICTVKYNRISDLEFLIKEKKTRIKNCTFRVKVK